MRLKTNLPAGWSRRSLLKSGAALGAGLAASPLLGRSAFAQDTTLNFWQFYAPDGEVKSRVDWFVKMVDDYNATMDPKVHLEYVVNTEYMNGTKLATSFASGQGPDIFIISPGDFLRYYNGGVLAGPDPPYRPRGASRFPGNRDRQPQGGRQDLRHPDGS